MEKQRAFVEIPPDLYLKKADQALLESYKDLLESCEDAEWIQISRPVTEGKSGALLLLANIRFRTELFRRYNGGNFIKLGALKLLEPEAKNHVEARASIPHRVPEIIKRLED